MRKQVKVYLAQPSMPTCLTSRKNICGWGILNVKNMSRRPKPKQDETGNFISDGQAAKSGLNKSIADAGWSQFVDILTFKAEKAGQRAVSRLAASGVCHTADGSSFLK